MRSTANCFVYDGWNLIAELDSTNNLVKSYTWGLDLSGSMQGAGGVGGLLSMTVNSTKKTYYYCYDGNGNVVALVDSITGAKTYSYEYTPFGKLVSGGTDTVNPFRFSTKYVDSETALSYYGYRFYYAEMGRWLNRDPIEERGGVNLYGFVGNDGVNHLDNLGSVSLLSVLVVAVAEGVGIAIDSAAVPNWANDKIIDGRGGPNKFMDETEDELYDKGGALPRDLFRKARALNRNPINETSEVSLHDRLQAALLSSPYYKQKRDFIIKRLKEGTLYKGFIPVNFQEEGKEKALGLSIGGGQLHYDYKPCEVEFRLKDTYDFTNKGHMWGRLQNRGFLVTYDEDIFIEIVEDIKAAPEVK